MTDEQRLIPKPANLTEAIAAHHQMKYYLDWYKQAEKEARTDLADFMCIQDDEYCGKTLDAVDGSKIRLSVTRTLKLDDKSDRWRQVCNMKNDPEKTGVTAAMIDDFWKMKTTWVWSMTGWNNLPDHVREYLEPVVTHAEALKIDYIQPKDDR